MNILDKLKEKTTKPTDARLRLVVYGSDGTGKSHFCSSFPNTIYIDTEGLAHYKKFVSMVEGNGGEMVSCTDIEEMIDIVKFLLQNKTDYKTLVIDSLSNAFKLSCELEAERLANGSKRTGSKDVEGTEFGRNKSKPTRKIFYLCNLLCKLDMNVIITSWVKPVYVGDSVIGNEQDVGKEAAHLLGTKIEAQKRGSIIPKGFVSKSRYEELPQESSIELTYENFKKIFGEEMFTSDCKTIELASNEQLSKLSELIDLFKLDEEITNKWLVRAKCSSFSEMEAEKVQACINSLLNKMKA